MTQGTGGEASIRQKLTRIIMVTSSVALLLASALFMGNSVLTARRGMVNDLSDLAKVVGANCIAPLQFDDPKAAGDTLSSLRSRPSITHAGLYDQDGHLFAQYVRPDSDGAAPLDAAPPVARARFAAGHLTLSVPLVTDGARIGTICLQSDMRDMNAQLLREAGIVAATLLASVLVAFLLSSQMQRLISGPILELANTAKVVADSENYSIRAPLASRDEIGYLTRRFNEMLAQIEARDAALHEANLHLVHSERDAQAASQTKSDFLANMSHELRTPLNAIIGYSEMLSEDAQDGGHDEFIPDLEKIHSAGKHLLALINDILDLSKIEAGKMELYVEEFQIAPMVQDVVTTIQPLVRKKDNRLEVRCPEALGVMCSDMTKIRQALFNLLSNASKFTQAGVITLEVTREAAGDAVLFRVSDTGIGMSAEQMGRLFQAFSQADASTTRKYGGTGLGLAITRHFCRMMGGDVSVDSEEGRGTTFTLRLPARVQAAGGDPSERAAEAAAPDADVGAAGLRPVLVIDDDATSRDLLQRLVSREGLPVVTAASGEEGLRLARELRPAAITLDVMMPGMDGWAVLAALKSAPDLCDIPVIMITIVDDRSLGYALGASDYLTKPVDRDRLAALLQKYERLAQDRYVLIVEDDEDARQVLRQTLQGAGWAVAEAEDGQAALRLVAESVPALILLDLMMPEMDGFDFVETLRGREEWRKIPVVVVTAKEVTTADRQRLNGYVQKVMRKGGYGREELMQNVRDLVARSGLAPGTGGGDKE